MLNILQIHCNHTIEFEFSTFKIDNNILFIFMDTFWEKNIFQSKLSNLKDWHLCQKLPQICAFAQQWYRMGRSAQAPLPRKWDGVGWLKILGCQLPYRDRERGGDGAERSFTSAKFAIPMLARASKKLQPACFELTVVSFPPPSLRASNNILFCTFPPSHLLYKVSSSISPSNNTLFSRCFCTFPPSHLLFTVQTRTSRNMGKCEHIAISYVAIVDGEWCLKGLFSYTTPHYYPKYEIWTLEKFLVNNPFRFHRLHNVKICCRSSFAFVGQCVFVWDQSENNFAWDLWSATCDKLQLGFDPRQRVVISLGKLMGASQLVISHFPISPTLTNRSTNQSKPLSNLI